ncbi:uncharacterized protein LOC132727916 [Ruditapes philippinarum]|uniref:uncharacterized protein LOC132727916 n=1 Tax=Ruditapes philippinarum TaxID=129788 RepID=UPI00295AA1E8|nr:uncharacterized protein LOC132727916 [Ruditapes philippinarum]
MRMRSCAQGKQLYLSPTDTKLVSKSFPWLRYSVLIFGTVVIMGKNLKCALFVLCISIIIQVMNADSDEEITCTSNADCPAKHICHGELGHCEECLCKKISQCVIENDHTTKCECDDSQFTGKFCNETSASK